jgi:hypothetical protein
LQEIRRRAGVGSVESVEVVERESQSEIKNNDKDFLMKVRAMERNRRA